MISKTFKLATIALISAASHNVMAVEGGVSQEWNEHPYLVESNCTGTVLAGNYVLLAGHCPNDFVNTADGKRLDVINRNDDLYSVAKGGADIAILKLSDTVKMDKALFTVDAASSVEPLQQGDEVYTLGFGRLDHNPKLGLSTSILDYYNKGADLSRHLPSVASAGNTVPGDSGAPVLNSENKLVGVHHSGIENQHGDKEQSANNIRTADTEHNSDIKNWLLSGINSWHSVTEVVFDGSQTIEIQSLHVNDVDMSDSWNNGTLTTGDVTATGGSCLTDGAVKPFGMCTLELVSNGEQGTITLNGYEITINRTVITPTPPATAPSSKSGGSFSLFGLMALVSLSLFRAFKK